MTLSKPGKSSSSVGSTQAQSTSKAVKTAKKPVRIIPFPFEKLPKLSKRTVEIEQALLGYLPFSAHENPAQKALESFLSKQFNLECRISFEGLIESQLDEWVRGLPEFFLGAVLGVHPIEGKVICSMDSTFGTSLIDRVLGGEGSPILELRELTAIEDGVFQYLLLKALGEMDQAMQEFSPVHFRLETTIKNRKDFVGLGITNTEIVVLKFRLQIGASAGFVTFAFPHPFVQGVFLEGQAINLNQPKMVAYGMKRFDELNHIRTQIWVEMGSVSLTPAEIGQLERGDVILFDQTQCQMIDEHLTGNAILRVGEGKEGGFLVQVVSSENPLILKLLNYYGGE